MRVDIILEPHLPAVQLARLAAVAEHYGIGGVWLPNNIAARDPFVNLVATAAGTRRIRLGPCAVSPFELHPMRMANALLTLNEESAGRAQIVVGGGGGTLQAMGLKPTRMVRAVQECVGILKLAASGQPGSYRGQVYPVGWLDASWATSAAPDIYVGANGPQMLAMAARVADGIMVSDFTAGRVRETRAFIEPPLRAAGRDPATFALSNFWAWHVKATRAEAHAEARRYLTARGTIWEPYVHDVLDPDEAKLVLANHPAFVKAYQARSPEIPGVPEAILDKLVAGGTSASSRADIEQEVERFRTFKAAGLTGIALCLYGDPEASIRLIGQHVVPAVA
jgi:5,10-methylenetetrahydromethanopterin reductase